MSHFIRQVTPFQHKRNLWMIPLTFLLGSFFRKQTGQSDWKLPSLDVVKTRSDRDAGIADEELQKAALAALQIFSVLKCWRIYISTPCTHLSAHLMCCLPFISLKLWCWTWGFEMPCRIKNMSGESAFEVAVTEWVLTNISVLGVIDFHSCGASFITILYFCMSILFSSMQPVRTLTAEPSPGNCWWILVALVKKNKATHNSW